MCLNALISGAGLASTLAGSGKASRARADQKLSELAQRKQHLDLITQDEAYANAFYNRGVGDVRAAVDRGVDLRKAEVTRQRGYEGQQRQAADRAIDTFNPTNTAAVYDRAVADRSQSLADNPLTVNDAQLRDTAPAWVRAAYQGALDKSADFSRKRLGAKARIDARSDVIPAAMRDVSRYAGDIATSKNLAQASLRRGAAESEGADRFANIMTAVTNAYRTPARRFDIVDDNISNELAIADIMKGLGGLGLRYAGLGRGGPAAPTLPTFARGGLF